MGAKKWAVTGAAAIAFGSLAWTALAQTPPTWDDVGPIFADNCTRCHGASHPTGLDLRSYASTIEGSNRGAVVIAGDSANSLLMQRITGAVGNQMPRGAPPLSDDLIALVAAWIDGGLQE